MKKKIIIILTIILLLVGIYFLYGYLRVKFAKVNITYKEDLSTEFLSEVHVSDFIASINGTITDDFLINTKVVGDEQITYTYINEDNIKLKQKFTIKVIDTTKPLILMSSSYSTPVGNTLDVKSKVLCGDNYDDTPLCEIIGDVDYETVGDYPLTFKATDASGNTTTKDFTIHVYEPEPSSNNKPQPPKEPTKTYFTDIVKNYKTSNTQIGLDISRFQGDIDFEALKNAGVEFLILRVGGNTDIDAENFLDVKFREYITEANRVDIPVGIYFFSYASNSKKAIEDANWVLKQIKDYKVDLPIAFDWENWNIYNEFNLSFFNLTNMANSFLDTVKKAGYDGLLYSSKSYLEQIWMPTTYPIWLAHYTSKTTYQGDFQFWQICSDGQVDGINGDVDIDIRYLK